MDIEENEGGGTSVLLVEGDDLASVPDSHMHLLSPQLRDAFRDPVSRFRDIAERCPFPEMARWLNALIDDPFWILELNQGDPQQFTSAGFYWLSETVRSASIDLPSDARYDYPPALADYYSLVGRVDWTGFGCAGGLDGAGRHTPLRTFPYKYHGAEVNPDDVFVWGWSPCGDMIIWSKDGRGGWMSHETGHIHMLGTIEDLINWLFAKLVADECPEYDYEWA